MSRWGKNIVVPLDSLLKEKENTNRPTVARSVGTVGKWGKMGFTSTRTYSLSALPAAMAAAAVAAATAASSPGESPASALDDDMSPTVPEPPKPKKFFKSRNAAPPEIIAQMIQQMPRASTSPIRDSSSSHTGGYLNTPIFGREPIKMKIPKNNSAERKKKSPKKPLKLTKKAAAAAAAADGSAADNSNVDEDNVDGESAPAVVVEAKPKKKPKEEKKLKPESTPSRVISRARKTVNYCEDDEFERAPTPLKDIIIPKNKQQQQQEEEEKVATTTMEEKVATTTMEEKEKAPPPDVEPELPPPAAPVLAAAAIVGTAAAIASAVQGPPKTPEHPPIVLRISKGTSRLVSTDSEELPLSSPLHETATKLSEPLKSRHTSTEEITPTGVASSSTVTPATIAHPAPPTTTPKIIVKPPRPPSPAPAPCTDDNEPPEINYCTVKISPDKPPKERLKLIIKTDVIRNAIAAAAAAEAAKAAAAAERAATAAAAASLSTLAAGGDKPEKEKKQKNKKHKHPKHLAVENLTPHPATTSVEFKTPSPHLALGELQQRTVISPPALSERDFDSQSSVLGSISSKGNSTPLAQTVQEESCVIHSRGSSVITSDLETSQHSSLVAPPSDIESRLESMMEGALDGDDVMDAALKVAKIQAEPLQEDILAVLRGDETLTGMESATTAPLNGALEAEAVSSTPPRRATRVRRGATNKTTYAEEPDESLEESPPTPKPTARGRRKTAEAPTPKRATRGRGAAAAKRSEEQLAMEVDTTAEEATTATNEETSPVKADDAATTTEDSSPTATATAVGRRGTRTRNNNNLSNNNNNIINKIVADLSAKAGAAEESAKAVTAANNTNQRSYGRKRKNQQVTQVLQPDVDDIEQQPPPHKLANVQQSAIDLPPTQELPEALNNETHSMDFDAHSDTNVAAVAPHVEQPAPNTTSPPRRDYKIKDKFKRTLMLDHQASQSINNCNAASAAAGGVVVEEEQRAAVKLVISKKKGSIFKSRALVPDQADQAAAKRHLYKHRWDADANGSGGSGDTASDAAATSAATATGAAANSKTDGGQNAASTALARTAADAIFADFSEDLSGGTHSRDNSPSLKLTRCIKPNPQANPYDMDGESGGGGDTITSVKVDRKAKEFYTVVRNVKTAHQIQEIGEYQEMDDDVEYILDALQPHNPTPTRCLSALQLATKCMTPAFRMHVRAHGIVTKFFKALSDANTDLSLGLCTTAIMYILSQEGLNMDLDRDSLELMMNLLEAEGVAAEPSDHANYERNKQKVRELCEEIKAQGKATHLNCDTITVGTLAMETLLSLTSKRAGEWFKEELRELGGLEHIIKTISDCSRPVIDGSNTDSGAATPNINWTQSLLDNMKTVERCMRVMENVTQMNEENQKYMLTYARGNAVNTLCSLYRLCDRELLLYPTSDFTTKENPGIILRELLIPLMKVLINLTHTFNSGNALGAELLGKRVDVFETSIHILLQVPNYIPERCVFELNILVLLFLINLTMHTAENRTLIVKTYAPPEFGNHYADQQNKISAVQALMDYFYKCEELARLVEKNTDAILDNSDKNKKKQEEVDETVNNLLQKAGHHMEHTMKGSYAGILIGHLITDSEENEAIVRKYLRSSGFKEIVSVLEKYYTFMNLTASSEASTVAHIKSTKKLIDYFKKRDLVYEMNDDTNACGLPLNLETHASQATTNRSNSNASTTQRVYKTYSQR